MASMRQICQDVAREIPETIPNSIFNNSDTTAQLLLASGKKILRDLSKKDWLILIKEHTFSTSAGQPDYPLPGDFLRILNQTIWNQNDFWTLRGSLTPSEWQQFKNSGLSSGAETRGRWRIRSADQKTKRFWIDPTPGEAEPLIFEYISNNVVLDSANNPASEWKTDNDVPLFDEELINKGIMWRFLNRKGLPYGEEKLDYDNDVDTLLEQEYGAPILRLNRRNTLRLVSPCDLPDGNYGV